MLLSLLSLLAAPAQAKDACPFRPETWNLYQDDDGCPDGSTISVHLVDANGAPEPGVYLTLSAPHDRANQQLPTAPGTDPSSFAESIPMGRRMDLPLFVEEGMTAFDVVVDNWPAPPHPSATEGTVRPDRWRVEATTDAEGVARFEGLRPDVPITLHKRGRPCPAFIERTPASDLTVTVTGACGEARPANPAPPTPAGG